MAKFKEGEAVRWTSSNTHKEGVVVGIVPAGRLPRDVGFRRIGDTSLSRDHESYVIRGAYKGGRQQLYWPHVSLLRAAEGLTVDEVAWCQANADRVREFITANREIGLKAS